MVATIIIAMSIISDVRPTPVATGVASYYSTRESGHITASGEKLNNKQHTCAMLQGNFGDYYNVVADNGKSVRVRLTDRGPYVKGRVIDLSKAAMKELTNGGLIKVKVYASKKD